MWREQVFDKHKTRTHKIPTRKKTKRNKNNILRSNKRWRCLQWEWDWGEGRLALALLLLLFLATQSKISVS